MNTKLRDPAPPLATAYDLLARACYAADRAALAAVLGDSARAIGAQGATGLLVQRNHHESTILVHAVYGHGVRQAWIRKYIENDYASIDPLLRRCIGTESTHSSEDLYSSNSPANDAFWADAARFGQLDRVGAGRRCPAHANVFAFVAYTGVSGSVSPQLKSVLGIVTIGFMFGHRRLTYASDASLRLTPRERELIKWIVEGKSAWMMGEILGISERTVKFHVNNIYQKLGVTTRAQAVAKLAPLRMPDLQLDDIRAVVGA